MEMTADNKTSIVVSIAAIIILSIIGGLFKVRLHLFSATSHGAQEDDDRPQDPD